MIREGLGQKNGRKFDYREWFLHPRIEKRED